jgi:hypothetical protein
MGDNDEETMRRSCSTIRWRRTGSGAATWACQAIPVIEVSQGR